MSVSRDTIQATGLYEPSFEHDACGVGFVVHVKGERSHSIIRDALTALNNLNHRGAVGCEVNTGDGAGLLIQIPHEFFLEMCLPWGIRLPGENEYGVGCFYMPKHPEHAEQGRHLFETIVGDEGQRFLGWRRVPTDNASLGEAALSKEPLMEQAFVGWGRKMRDPDEFERKLLVIRKRFESNLRASTIPDRGIFYVCSLSCYTLVYKGMLTPWQLDLYFRDLREKSLKSAFCIFHARFSTNTFPNWELAHPFRMIAHNGEINTLRGNINWMHARETLLESSLFDNREMEELLPIVREGQSDTATLDNVIELLIKAGRSPSHAMMMLIPEAWENHNAMSQARKDFYRYHASLMEPWDGPASIVFTDGKMIGATLDRNGLRPSRYIVTQDDRVVLASEVGVLDIPPEKIVGKGRLEPGKMFLIDLTQGRLVDDDAIKEQLARGEPYGIWIEENEISMSDLPESDSAGPSAPDYDTLLRLQQAFGYTIEDQKYVLGPMAREGMWAIGSMGTDTPLAVLSDRPQLLYNYFKQLFAQVTNPPLDPIREELVTSVAMNLGPERNLLDPRPETCRQIALRGFVLRNEDIARIKHLNGWRGFKSALIPMVFPVAEGWQGMEKGLDEMFEHATRAIEEGANILVLTDRGVDERNAPIPSLLGCAGLHNHLVRQQKRNHVGLVVESGDCREVHHFCLLIGYGATAINPYVAFYSIEDMVRQAMLEKEMHLETAIENYVKAVTKGVVKVMARMGISVLRSYHGAQIFEAIGLSEEFIEKYFTNTTSRISGIGLKEITEEILEHHRRAYPARQVGPKLLAWGGQYQWRREGEYHLFNPETVYRLQYATRSGRYDIFKSYSNFVNDQSRRLCTLRGLMEFRMERCTPIPIEEVEPVERIVRRFCTGAMSYGSISAEAHETLAIAMNRLGGWSNTGEGGEDPRRYLPDANGDSRRSRIKQVASGRFGVTSEYLVSADEIQIKMAQGAKPGEGGELPADKVYPWIAATRHTTPGVGLISPPPHHDIYSIEDLAQLIYDLKCANPRARISVKLVSEVGVGTVAAGVAKANADVVLISGHDGGTGASPLTSIKHAGVPWELGLAETQQTLVMNKLRDRIIVQTDGQLRTGRDVVVAALLGAEEFGFATAPLVTLGCVLMRVCHLDTCPVGIATQNPELRKRFQGKPEYVINFFLFLAQEVREIMSQLGFRTMDEMIGRSDLLDMKHVLDHFKARGLDLSRLLYRPEPPAGVAPRCVRHQVHDFANTIDQQLLHHRHISSILNLPVRVRWCPAVQDDLDTKKAVETVEGIRIPPQVFDLPIRNVHRAVGTLLGSEITRRFGPNGLPEDSIYIKFTGTAGQSFGAFLPHGMTLVLEGDANDYVGKGLSGGKIIVYPPRQSGFPAERNILIGNVALYGATRGKAFFRGVAGERFAVRNSGAVAVVEGTGDHCCEYMTGGSVVVIGETGRNFAAGMSGGIAFVYDPTSDFHMRCNLETVELQPFVDDEDIAFVRRLLEEHLKYTHSTVAELLLHDWHNVKENFVKVMPNDFKRALQKQRRESSNEVLLSSSGAAHLTVEVSRG